MSTMAWWWHTTPLVRSSSLKQGSGENVAKFGVCLSQQVQIPQSEYPGKFNRSMWRKWNEIISMRAWTMNISACWLAKSMVNTPLATLTCSLWLRSWQDGQELEIPCSQRPPQWEDQGLPGHRHQGTCFPLGSRRAIIPLWLNQP